MLSWDVPTKNKHHQHLISKIIDIEPTGITLPEIQGRDTNSKLNFKITKHSPLSGTFALKNTTDNIDEEGKFELIESGKARQIKLSDASGTNAATLNKIHNIADAGNRTVHFDGGADQKYEFDLKTLIMVE
ncbi:MULTISPECIES: hypothetical protein [unclassified Treponema]|uniref:hypothetical protein n=1 Tax=unclassified Treponema TaxID=2638727 RepID=UPI0020A4FB0E|nr:MULTISPECIES: hypothetical protein [unclassified Treponema]UTC67361.1 hypothetical protein E4O06_01430 [Treponema sp. OMZ 789]UTC70089.1 hypothetical protein E4O01_01425 [Treponema sp. OMZ 790]UTC72805.1 hypothetical protein E4O02_01425 [Treponema sp. OMZ 791]